MIKALHYFNDLRQGTFLDVIFWKRLSHQIVLLHGRVWSLHHLFLRTGVVSKLGIVNPSKYIWINGYLNAQQIGFCTGDKMLIERC